MTDPTAPEDDNWNELARELGLDDAPRPTAGGEPPTPYDAEDSSEYEDATLTETGGEGTDADSEEADGEPEGEAECQAGDEQPGTGRKRRRRRRRRKKGAPGGEPVAEGEPLAVATDEPEDQLAAQDRPGQPFGDAEAEDEAVETGGVLPAAEEDTGSEVLRELIATWNVPSWDDIVAGLYRPER